jgi:branched-chain amino acid transport system ATP-binding protein
MQSRDLAVGYHSTPVILGMNFEVRANELLCLIGHNGAGKSTLLKCLFGLLPASGGEIWLDGGKLVRPSPSQMVAAGVAMTPEGRGVFPSLTAREIMAMSMRAAGVPKAERANRVDWVLDILPAVKEFYDRRAGTLSGGQQQMISIGRALLGKPRILLLDEPSVGLAPKLFNDILQPIRQLQQSERMSIVLVEQNVREALKLSDRAVVMRSGAIIWEGSARELEDNQKLMELY